MKILPRFLLLALAVVVIFSAAGCGASFEYDEEAYVTRAKEVIELANQSDYEAICAMFNDDMAAALTCQQLEESIDPILTAAGSFVQYDAVKTQGTTQNGVNYIVVAAVCQYENSTQTYTISLTTDMMVGGLYIK